MVQPANDLLWATNDVTDGNNIENKVRPYLQVANQGIQPYSNGQETYGYLGHSWWNWIWNNTSNWQRYFRGRYQVNDVIALTVNESIPTLDARYGGLWTALGSDTFASTTFYFYRTISQGQSVMPRPDEYSLWATNNVVDPVTGNPNKRRPTTFKENNGQISSQSASIPTAQEMNYLFDLNRQWQQFEDEKIDTGSTHFTTDTAKTVAQVQDQFGGTWALVGNETIAGTAMRIFQRTGA